MPMPASQVEESQPPVEINQAHAQAGLRAIFRLFALWSLTDAQSRVLLGQPSPSTLYRWKTSKSSHVPYDTILRIGDLLGIHKALGYMFVDHDQRYAWISRPNKVFGGQSALDRMLAGTPADIQAVRAYLDAERGAW